MLRSQHGLAGDDADRRQVSGPRSGPEGRQQIDALRRQEDFMRFTQRVDQIVDSLGIVDAFVEEGLGQAIAIYQDAIRDVT